ncbi:MAG TPA: isoprenylcysteine carboxylmethyltransferase family protein [Terriglobales bacterium]|jgi:protein-S-isoprenylcysteine O-methyltransferase Ste14|nr:isoprenylcysteine carboxylmethyltransferase family protein [Terriglobales bacterium]
MTGMTICGYIWATFLVVWLILAIKTKPVQHRETVSSRLSYTIVTFAAFYLVFAGEVRAPWLRLHILPANAIVEALGVVLTAAGIALAFWARAFLGGNWSGTVTVKVGHQLVRTGPYRWVRHPIYSGLILALIGTAIERRQVRGAIAVILLYIGFKIKSRIEERTMTNTFGAEYADYSRTTGAIVPKLPF